MRHGRIFYYINIDVNGGRKEVLVLFIAALFITPSPLTISLRKKYLRAILSIEEAIFLADNFVGFYQDQSKTQQMK